jgi:hypothetical protein
MDFVTQFTGILQADFAGGQDIGRFENDNVHTLCATMLGQRFDGRP